MPQSESTLSQIGRELSLAFTAWTYVLEDAETFAGFMLSMGWEVEQIPPPIQELADFATSIQDLLDNTDEIDVPALVELFGPQNVGGLIESIQDLQHIDGTDLPQVADLQAFRETFPRKFLDFILITYLESYRHRFYLFFKLAGLITEKHLHSATLDIDYIERHFAFEQIPDLFSDPLVLFKQAYQWGTPDFAYLLLVDILSKIINEYHQDYAFRSLHPDMLAFLTQGAQHEEKILPHALSYQIYPRATSNSSIRTGLQLFYLPQTHNALPGFAVLPYAEGSTALTFDLNETLQAIIEAEFAMDGGVGILVRPNKKVALLNEIIANAGGTPPLSGALSLKIRHQAVDSEPTLLLGTPDSTRLEYAALSLGAGVRIMSQSDKELFVELGLEEFKLVIGGGDGDGFLQKIFPEDGLEIAISTIMGFSSERGLYFQGTSGLVITVPAHITLGPVEIKNLTLSILPEDQDLVLITSTMVKADLGPFAMVVENIGLKTAFAFPGEGGNLGPLDLGIGFKPPNGIGLSLDAGSVRGGGYIFFDPDKGEYAGVAELTVINLVSVKAIAIINTKMPDGSKGFAFLLIISAEFSPIQLGFGFTLNGVGGIVAINRGVHSEAILQGVIDNSADDVLFPDDPVANAPTIIANLNAFFPITRDQYAFGFMGLLGWGTPTLVSLEMGLIFVFPEPVSFIILGKLSIALPDEKVPLVSLQVNFFGEINFTEGYMYFFASLYNSKIAQWSIEGSMYFAINWKGNPNFVFSIGGFHPDYRPPALRGGLGSLKRITLNMLGGNNPRLTLTFYMAITSNTVQFGAAADFMAKAWKIRVVGYLYFDALFQFNPFYFKISIGAGLAVMWGSKELFGIHLAGSLEGPSPWRIKGTASFRILLVKVKVRVDKTFGTRKDTSLPPKPILPFLQEPLRDQRNWIASQPATRKLLVTTRKLETENPVAHPYSTIGVSQNRIPLHQRLDKVGSNEPADYIKFKLRWVELGSDAQRINDFFAPAEYIRLSNAQKLSRKSYEKFRAGIKAQSASTFVTGETRIDGNDIMGDYVVKTLEHELCIIDRLEEEAEVPNARLTEDPANFGIFVRGNAVAQSKLGRESSQHNTVLQNRIQMSTETYKIVDKKTQMALRKNGTDLAFQSETQAKTLLAQMVQKQPALKGSFAVIAN